MATSLSETDRAHGAGENASNANGHDRENTIRQTQTTKRASAPLNFMRPALSPDRERERPAVRDAGVASKTRRDPHNADPAKAPEAPPSARTGRRTSLDTHTMPTEVRERYIQDGRKYYFPNGDPAFVDRGDRITTRSENTAVIQDFSRIAQARQWGRVEVGGTEVFRREAWRAAKLAGLEVVGYRPTAVEQAQLVRALARRQERDLPLRADTKADPARRASAAPPADRADSADRAPRHADRWLVGTLIDHGHDHYRFQPHGEMSYFVRVETPQGVRTRWGVDLERAVEKSLSGVKTGDRVGVRPVGQEPVKVMEKVRDPQGRVTGEREVETHRNRWIIETTDFLKERQAMARVVRDPAIDAQDAVRQYPALKGTYTNLKVAELMAQKQIGAADQRAFVSRIRNDLANAVEWGEPLSSAIRVRSSSREPVPERTAARTL